MREGGERGRERGREREGKGRGGGREEKGRGGGREGGETHRREEVNELTNPASASPSLRNTGRWLRRKNVYMT